MCDHLDVDMPKFDDDDTFRFEGDQKETKKGG